MEPDLSVALEPQRFWMARFGFIKKQKPNERLCLEKENVGRTKRTPGKMRGGP